MVSAWPVLALVGALELLMTMTRKAASPPPAGTAHQETVRTNAEHASQNGTELEQTPEQAVLSDYLASLNGSGEPLSQRFLAEKRGLDRRKVRRILATVAHPHAF
jgi:hypothetical protein